MCQSSRVAPGRARTDEQQRRDLIHAAAVREFSRRGFVATSMADIAEAAGMSRPALYQYFRNKGDVFGSAFAALIDDSVDRALGALRATVPLDEQLDGFLQRFDGDLWEQMAASPHSQELLDAKYAHAAEASARALARLHRGLVAHLRGTGADRGRRDGWVELLELSPRGFKLDQPSVAVYRRRLRDLARSVAADIERSSVAAPG
jgi:AcrR family transcriptional regulator